MNIVDIISDKRYGKRLTSEQIRFFVRGVTDRSIPDYQTSALLMAIVLNGMDEQEMTDLTLEMAHSGQMNDLSFIGDITVDKHSTGGVGDKITPLVMSICAVFGVRSVKLTGKGLGFTGGTYDKFASVRGFNIDISRDEFPYYINKCGMCISGQSASLAPADKILYSLRDVTGTVDSIPLIASSVMSKKIAGGADRIVLDVTCGSGAFMKTLERARKLASAMIRIGNLAGRRTVAVITDMDQPLGRFCGNILEMREVWDTLSGNGSDDVIEVACALASQMILLSGKGHEKESDELITLCKNSLSDGSAKKEFIRLIKSQQGIITEDGPVYKDEAVSVFKLTAQRSGYIKKIQTDEVGYCSVLLGAGRLSKDDLIDYGAGIEFKKKAGDFVNEGDEILELYTGKDSKIASSSETMDMIVKRLYSSYTIADAKPSCGPSVIDILS